MKKSLIFDFGVLVITVCLLAAVLVPKKSQEKTEPVFVSIKIVRDAKEVHAEAIKGGESFFNSQNQPVQVVSAVWEGDATIIKIKGPGKIEENRYIFNGLRVLVGQKAELHGRFFAQGVISEVKNAN